MDHVFKIFSEYLTFRLTDHIYTTEDSVRYVFFASLLQSLKLSPNDVILEYPHDVIKRAKIDTFIPGLNNSSIAIEFKYDRKIPSGKNSPKPQKAGKLFNDIRRLLLFKQSEDIQCYFIYLTDEEMNAYLTNQNNKLKDFYCIEPHNSLRIDANYIANKSKTFQQSVGGELVGTLTCVMSETLPCNHFLRVYSVVS